MSSPHQLEARPLTSRGLPGTFWAGLIVIAACELLLALDVSWSARPALRSAADFAALSPPHGPAASLARWVAINMTPLAWAGYLLLLEGLLRRIGISPVRQRPHHFALLLPTSIIIWCLFDWVNFYFIHAWNYLSVPISWPNRLWGYTFAFAAIVPGMLMSGQLLMDMGLLNWVRGPAWRMPRWLPWAVGLTGAAMFLWPLVARDPITNFTLWTSLVFLLDPINDRLGRPSVLRDWRNGWYGRTLAAFAGGLICGLLWEFWNYWALAKWVYHLPFLGPLEHVRYFEMPLPGLLGFIPFGLECWVIWQTVRIALDGLAEPLPDARHLL
jgi:hypothetical protein